jgi:hypothetical protein
VTGHEYKDATWTAVAGSELFEALANSIADHLLADEDLAADLPSRPPARVSDRQGVSAVVRGMYAVVHSSCGHAAAVVPDRAGAEGVRQALAAGGDFRWRVRLIPADELEAVVIGLVESDPQSRGCATCRVDVERASALMRGTS